MPTFCRHNRFLERCPICSKTLAAAAQEGRATAKRAGLPSKGARARTRRPVLPGDRSTGRRAVRVQHEKRAGDDGYRSELLPGLRASADAESLAQEIAFAHSRLLRLEEAPPDLYGEARALAEEDLERATWTCFLIAYLSPLEDEDAFRGVRSVLSAAPESGAWEDALGELDRVPLGPRSSHELSRGASTLLAYRHWAERAGGASALDDGAARAVEGDPQWSPQRRFERDFERLALPGFTRMARYDLLVTLGRLGLYELRADALYLTSGNGSPSGDLTTLAAKRVFAIGDPLLLERRARTLADAVSVPVEALDLALANWGSGQRATVGIEAESSDQAALERGRRAFEL